MWKKHLWMLSIVVLVRKKIFAWKLSKISHFPPVKKKKAHPWKNPTKCPWKISAACEKFQKSVRESHFPSVNKVEKRPKKAFTSTFDFHGKKKTLLIPKIPLSSWVAAFYFSRENQKCPWKLFFCLFSTFFTDGKWLSRTLFWNFSRAVEIFHGHLEGFFHGWVFFHGREMRNFR